MKSKVLVDVIPIELNKYYPQDQMVLVCGENAYKRLMQNTGAELREFSNEINETLSIETTWRIIARHLSNIKIPHFVCKYTEDSVKFTYASSAAICFFDYTEVRSCAEAILENGQFDRVEIVECIRKIPKAVIKTKEPE